MIFLVSYRYKGNASQPQANLRKKIFALYHQTPSRNDLEKLVRRVSEGDFAAASIEFEPCAAFDAEELSRCGVTVYQIEP